MILAAFAFSFLLLAGNLPAQDQVVFDFESGDLQGWRVVEGKLDYVVSDRATFHNRYPDYPDRTYNKQGTYYLSTVEMPEGPSNDSMTGVLESPVFELTGPEISHRSTWSALGATVDAVRKNVFGIHGL
jgi:hypothetical protein